MPNNFKLLLVAVFSIFLQLLILKTGGFYSPLLILLHLFALGISFLFSLRVAFEFLGFSLVVLFAGTFIDEKLLTMFINDLWSSVLYILSFIIILPLSGLTGKKYQVQDKILKLLKAQLELTSFHLEIKDAQLELAKKREESLFQGLPDGVVITDTNLRILFLNENIEKIFGIPSSELLARNFFDIMHLKDTTGNLIDDSLSIDLVTNKGKNYLFNDLQFFMKGSVTPIRAALRIQPVRNLEENFDQIVFIISNMIQIKNQPPVL